MILHQDDKVYPDDKFYWDPSRNTTVLTLQGTEDNSGTYACRLYNSVGESRKYFYVTFVQDPGSTFNTTFIAVVVVLLIALVAGLGIGIKLYRDKV